jgi:transcription antitermination factor NusG
MEPSDSPAMLAGAQPDPYAPGPADASCGDWWVVHTKPRQEKALAGDLTRLGVVHFLPLVSVRRKTAGRVIQRYLPLFPSYLFFCGRENERYATLTTHRVANMIAVSDQEQLRRDLHQIHTVVCSQEPVDLYPAIQQGKRCRVIQGPLAGLEGVVLRRRDVCRVYVGVQVLGQSAEMEIDPALLEVVE